MSTPSSCLGQEANAPLNAGVHTAISRPINPRCHRVVADQTAGRAQRCAGMNEAPLRARKSNESGINI